MGAKYNEHNEENLSSVAHNALANSTLVKGDLSTDGDFRLDGRIEGTISCGGKIVIGPTAQVQGDIISVNAEILGTVIGSITTSEVLVLKPSAIIKGIITTQALVVEPSAKFSGTCNMTLPSEEETSEQLLNFNSSSKAESNSFSFQHLNSANDDTELDEEDKL
jgi:cytoskeletal protein CcmA (bactofilin family)